MKEVGRCPNCGAKLPKGKHGIVKCEYCDSEFADETPRFVIGDIADNYLRMVSEYNDFKICRIGSIQESQTEYIEQIKQIQKEVKA